MSLLHFQSKFSKFNKHKPRGNTDNFHSLCEMSATCSDFIHMDHNTANEPKLYTILAQHLQQSCAAYDTD